MNNKFFNAWWFLVEHKAFQDKKGFFTFEQSLNIDVVMVNPETKRVDDDKKKNTLVQVWLECGRYEKNTPERIKNGEPKEYHVHDIRLDTGGDNFEIAIERLARLVKKHYGA